jgi:patatin-like phospholipase/acyl hydrolase
MNILSLSGGGAQGLFSALVLERLEDEVGPLSHQFDFLAGTSIGAALACSVAWNIPMQETTRLFENSVEKIFPSSPIQNPDINRLWKASRGMITARYASVPWRNLLETLFKESLFGESPVPIVVPAIHLETGKLKRFCSWDPEDAKLSVVDVVLASSAAPTFFPVHKMPNGELYVDGGMSSNSPDMVALTEVVAKRGEALKNVNMMSVGTALASPKMFQVGQDLDWGLRQWGSKDRISNLSMAVTQNTPTCLVKDWLGERYFRIDTVPNLSEQAYLGLDGACPRAVIALKKMSQRVILDDLIENFSWNKA